MLVAIALALLPQAAPAPSHRLHIGKGPACQIAFDGRTQNYTQLRNALARSARSRPEPTLRLDLDPAAPYWCVDRVTKEIKRARVTKIVFLGNAAKPVAKPPTGKSPAPR